MVELGVIIVLVILLGWQEYNNRKERKSMLNAILAKNNQELVNLELADKTEIKTPNSSESEYVTTDSLPDDEYRELITGKKNG